MIAAALMIPVVSATPAQAQLRSSEQLCADARDQVVQWSVDQAEDPVRGRAHVVAISRVSVGFDRTQRFPESGVALKCAGRAKLSSGVRTRVTFGFRAYDSTLYLFLKRVPGQ